MLESITEIHGHTSGSQLSDKSEKLTKYRELAFIQKISCMSHQNLDTLQTTLSCNVTKE